MSSQVTKVQSQDRVIQQIQTNIVGPLNTLLTYPLNNGTILSKVSLQAGDNTIPHKLNRSLVGWFAIRSRSAAQIYDKQDTNPLPNKTLILNASAAVVVDLLVF